MLSLPFSVFFLLLCISFLALFQFSLIYFSISLSLKTCGQRKQLCAAAIGPFVSHETWCLIASLYICPRPIDRKREKLQHYFALPTHTPDQQQFKYFKYDCSETFAGILNEVYDVKTSELHLSILSSLVFQFIKVRKAEQRQGVLVLNTNPLKGHYEWNSVHPSDFSSASSY